MFGAICTGGRYDVGQKLDFLRANVELALDRDDLGPAFGDVADASSCSGRVASRDLARRRASTRSSTRSSRWRRESFDATTRAVSCSPSDVVAAEPVPPFANTGMDGYAVRAADTAAAPVRLRVVGELPAGRAPTIPVGAGEAIRIMTGAPMPDGADAVVMVERTHRDGDDVVVDEAARAGRARAAGRRRLEAGDRRVRGGHGAHARAPRCAREPRRARGALPPAAARRRDLDRRRARRARSARAGAHPRLEPADAARRGRRGGLRGGRRRHRARRRGRDHDSASTHAVDDVRRARSRAARCRWATTTS